MDQAKKSKKQRKVGRNAKYCQLYAVTHRREKNKIRKINRHLKKFPADKVAINALKVLRALI